MDLRPEYFWRVISQLEKKKLSFLSWVYLMVYFNGNRVRSPSCPEWQNDCYEIHLVKDRQWRLMLISFIMYLASIHRCICSGFCAVKSGGAMPQLSCLMTIPYDICIWCFYFSWRIDFSSCLLISAPILAMFIKYIELKLVSEAICYVWLSYFFWLAEFFNPVMAPAMKVLLYHELGVKNILIILQCLCAVRSVRKLRWVHLFSNIHTR